VLLIPCPWCGDREQAEFTYGGQAGVLHPPRPETLADPAWAEYVFFRDNPAGVWRERWVHTAGCRQWLTVERDTTTNEIRSSRLAREARA
jgi:sarcosine oxidase, subunit delta